MKNEDVLKKSSFLRIFFCFEGFDGFDGFDKICLMENGSSSFVFQVMRILKRPRLVNLHHARHGHEFCILMKRRGRVFRVRSKPSKQPLGPVNMEVPIENVQAKPAMHSDWGGPTLDKAVYLGFEVSPQNNPSDWLHVVFQ